MKKLSVLIFLSLAALPVMAAGELYVYPNAGQSNEQQRQDRYECHRWAVAQTGFDPSTTIAPGSGPVAVGPVLHEEPMNPVAGAAGGAALGAAGGAIAGDAGKGAAIGAGVGALAAILSGITTDERNRQREADAARRAAEAQNQQASQVDGRRAEYTRAISACLEGRNYTVR